MGRYYSTCTKSTDNLDHLPHIKDYSVSPCWQTFGWYITHYAPYKISDHLYVKEGRKIYEKKVGSGESCYTEEFAVYRADSERNTKKSSEWYEGKWNSPVRMPKELARIWLNVTSVKIERLLDITEEDCRQEGFVDRNLYWQLDGESDPEGKGTKRDKQESMGLPRQF